MILYILIGLCFSLLGAAGVQFVYLFYLGRLDVERKKRVAELEQTRKELLALLAEARTVIASQEQTIHDLETFRGRGEEAWADIIEDL